MQEMPLSSPMAERARAHGEGSPFSLAEILATPPSSLSAELTVERAVRFCLKAGVIPALQGWSFLATATWQSWALRGRCRSVRLRATATYFWAAVDSPWARTT